MILDVPEFIKTERTKGVHSSVIATSFLRKENHPLLPPRAAAYIWLLVKEEGSRDIETVKMAVAHFFQNEEHFIEPAGSDYKMTQKHKGLYKVEKETLDRHDILVSLKKISAYAEKISFLDNLIKTTDDDGFRKVLISVRRKIEGNGDSDSKKAGILSTEELNSIIAGSVGEISGLEYQFEMLVGTLSKLDFDPSGLKKRVTLDKIAINIEEQMKVLQKKLSDTTNSNKQVILEKIAKIQKQKKELFDQAESIRIR